MTNWILLGGCLLGLFGVEWVQRVLFPGETSLWGWWRGRTRRQEQLTGGDSASRITPQFDLRPDRVLNDYTHYCRRLQVGPPSEVEESLRKRLFETKDRNQRVLLYTLLAQASILLDNRSEAHALIEEARESLRSDWRILDPTFRMVASTVKQVESLLYLQEGNCPIVLDLLEESEQLFGKQSWITVLRGETYLLKGELRSCQTHLLKFLNQEEKENSGKAVINLPAGSWAILAESYLRGHDWERLDRVLATCVGLKKLSIEDRAAVLRLRVELSIKDHQTEEAWMNVEELGALANNLKYHRGLARTFQLASARAHFYEGNTTESLRRLQLAENECRYPVALWEVEFFRALVLETEDRMEDAISTWENLSRRASGTYYGRVAQNRWDELERQSSQMQNALITTGAV